MRSTLVARGSTLYEVIVAMQIVAVALSASLPLHVTARGIASGNGPLQSAGAGGRARDAAAHAVQALLEWTVSLPYARLRDGAACAGTVAAMAARRVFPGDARDGELTLPPGVTRAEVILEDVELPLDAAPDLDAHLRSCRPRRVVVRVWTAGVERAWERSAIRAER